MQYTQIKLSMKHPGNWSTADSLDTKIKKELKSVIPEILQILKSAGYFKEDPKEIALNEAYQKIGQTFFETHLKLNTNCKEEEKVGGEHPCDGDKTQILVDITAPSTSALENMIKGDPAQDNDPLPWDDDYNVKIGNTMYQVRLEGWYGDCLESRGYDSIDPSEYSDVISKDFKQIVSKESGWGESSKNIYGYVKDVPGTTYGVTYIGKPIK